MLFRGSCRKNNLQVAWRSLLEERGIGRAIALELGERGADVAFNYAKSAEAADSLKAELEGWVAQLVSAVRCGEH